MNTDKEFKVAFWSIWGLALVGNLAFWGLVVFLVLHFT